MKNSIGNKHLTGIDYLRALAVLSVIAYHFNSELIPGGFVGVDLFFVISGFVITRSLFLRQSDSKRVFLLSFYRRRVLRLAPALLSYVVVVSAFSSLFIPDSWLSSNNTRTALASIFGLSNVYLARLSDGYFFERSPFNPFLHTWSLGVEEQFYFIFPLLFLALLALLKTRKKHVFASSGAVLAFLIFSSLIFSAWETSVSKTSAFYMLPARFWELLLGAAVFFLVHKNYLRLSGLSTIKRSLLLITGSSIVTLSLFMATEMYFPFFWALPPAIGAAMLLVSASIDSGTGRTHRSTVFRGISWVGRISYSLYLWHWGVLVAFRWTLGLEGPIEQLSALTIIFLLASISYYMVEKPFVTSLQIKYVPDSKVLFSGLGAALVAASLVVLLWFSHAQTSISQGDDATLFETSSIESMYEQTNVESEDGNGRTVFLAGDSHAGHLNHAVSRIALRNGFEYRLLQSVGCPVLGLNAVPKCESSANSLDLLFNEAKSGDIVIFSSLNIPRLSDQWATFNSSEVLRKNQSAEAQIAREQALELAVSHLGRLKEVNVNVLLVAPTPVFSSPPFRCLDWFNKMNPVCEAGFETSKSQQSELRLPVMKSYNQISDLGLAQVWDPIGLFCTENSCSSKKDEVFLFKDADHLSIAGNQYLLQILHEEILQFKE
jgi:peptidoglycan/LPS O-acetylase OafA/YrhL